MTIFGQLINDFVKLKWILGIIITELLRIELL
jgi:hypothetical protein